MILSSHVRYSILVELFNLRILVFTEGTILYHKNAKNQTQKTIVQQVKDKEPSTHDFSSYIPIGDAQKKLQSWHNLGHQILYLTSRKKKEEIQDIERVLSRYNFPKGRLLSRSGSEEYHEILEKILPNVFVEDDCESIGGETKMIYSKLRPDIQNKILPVFVREFNGIDHLPDNVLDLIQCKQP